MAINDKPCNTCVHYDPIVVGIGKRKPVRGWCAVKSVYLAVDPESRPAPTGVKRAAPGERATPVIVIGKDVVPHCAQFRAKPTL